MAGIVWETGVLFGLAEAGVDVTAADLVVGTSAGSTVGAQLGSGLPLAQLWARQAEPSRQNPELASPGIPLAEWMDTMARLAERHPDPRQLRRAIGAMALVASTVAEDARRAMIQARLPTTAGPRGTCGSSRWTPTPAIRWCSIARRASGWWTP